MATRGTRSAAVVGPIVVAAPLAPEVDRAGREARLAELRARVHRCQTCVEAGYLARAASVAGARGALENRVLLVGQAPGHLSVERGLPFSGPGGRVLDAWLTRAGFPAGALRTRVFISAMTRCDPGKSPKGSGDRKPSPAEVALCRPYLLEELETVRPAVILPAGGMAIEAFLGPQRLDAVIGRAFERNGARILPLPHPSGVSRWLNAPEHQALLARALGLLSAWRVELGL
jgi:uracil-DNA glycosylase family 4